MAQFSSSLDELILLNREIAALVKAGIPLELGLKGLAGSVGSRLGQLSERLSARLANGDSLPEALAEEGPAVSPVYTAVMEAGLASGRLPEALESLAASGQVIQEMHRRIFLAVLYPLICAVVGYILFCGFVCLVIPQLIDVAESFRFPDIRPIDTAKVVYQHRIYVTTVIPSAIFAMAVVTFLLRQSLTRGLWQWIASFRWVPGVSAIRRSQNWAQFTELMGMQLEHAAPLRQAILLSADSTDNAHWHREARNVCDQLEQGASLAVALQNVVSLPPLARWMISTGEQQGTLVPTLRQLSDMYRRIALRQAANLRTWLPVLITISVTGTIGLAYGLAFFVPMRALLTGLMNE